MDNRQLYPDIEIISVEAVQAAMEQFLIVDLRPAFAYAVLHIQGSVNLTINDYEFMNKLRRYISAHETRKIVFYCRDVHCLHAYEAVSRCKKAKFSNCMAMNDGLMIWARTYPKKTVLHGRQMLGAGELLAEENFKEKLLSTTQFDDALLSQDVKILELYSASGRYDVSLFPRQAKRLDVDDLVEMEKNLQQYKQSSSPLLIYDQHGKYIEWFMYVLQKNGIENYRFLQGGASAYWNAIRVPGAIGTSP